MTQPTQPTQPALPEQDLPPSTFEAWMERFKPVENSNSQSGFEYNNKPVMFETYGDDLAKVVQAKNANPDTVWTLLEVDGNMTVTNGFHLVNRAGYFITEVPFTGNGFMDIQVYDDDDLDDLDDLDDGGSDGDANDFTS